MAETEDEDTFDDLINNHRPSSSSSDKRTPVRGGESKRHSGAFNPNSNSASSTPVADGGDEDKPNIIMEGYLLKQTGMLKAWKQRKVRLLPQQLIFFNEANPKAQMKMIPLEGCIVEDAFPGLKYSSKDIAKLRKAYALRIVTAKKKEYIFSAETVQHKVNWINAIRNRDKKLPRDTGKQPMTQQLPQLQQMASADTYYAQQFSMHTHGDDEDGYEDEPAIVDYDFGQDEEMTHTPEVKKVQFAYGETGSDCVGIEDTTYEDQEVMAVMEKYNESRAPTKDSLTQNNAKATQPSRSKTKTPPQGSTPPPQTNYQPPPKAPPPPVQIPQQQASPIITSHTPHTPHASSVDPHPTYYQPPPPAPPPLQLQSQQHPSPPIQQQTPTPPVSSPAYAPTQPPATAKVVVPPLQHPPSPAIHAVQIQQTPPSSSPKSHTQQPQLKVTPQYVPPTTQQPPLHPAQPQDLTTIATINNKNKRKTVNTSNGMVSEDGLVVPDGTPLFYETLHALADTPLNPIRNRETPELQKLKEGYEKFHPNEDDYNNKYQKMVETLAETHNFEKAMTLGVSLTAFLGNFLAAAKSYGKTIIDEFHVLPQQKTIPPLPLDTDLPAESREEMYIHNGILFRFAVDNSGELNDMSAMKMASHELKGIKLLVQAHPTGMSTALTCMIDYKGFRLVAIAIFPADGERTMIYGITPSLVRIDEEVKRQLKIAASTFNVKDRIT